MVILCVPPFFQWGPPLRARTEPSWAGADAWDLLPPRKAGVVLRCDCLLLTLPQSFWDPPKSLLPEAAVPILETCSGLRLQGSGSRHQDSPFEKALQRGHAAGDWLGGGGEADKSPLDEGVTFVPVRLRAPERKAGPLVRTLAPAALEEQGSPPPPPRAPLAMVGPPAIPRPAGPLV